MLRLDSITCIVDAVGIFADGDNERLNLLKLRQIGFADMVVLNKTDLVGPEHIEVIKEWIDYHIHRIRIVEATQCDVPLDILLAVLAASEVINDVGTARKLADWRRRASSRTRWSTTGCSRPGVTSPIVQCRSMCCARWCRGNLPVSVYRCKGIVFAADSPDKRFALQVVGRRTEISELDEWGERTPVTKIVAIGSANELDPDSLTALFDSCISEAKEA